MCVNNLRPANKHSEVHHFADDTNLLDFNNYLKCINKQNNHGLKNLANSLKSNKVSLNVDKTELLLFFAL